MMKKYTPEQALSIVQEITEIIAEWDIDSIKQEKKEALKECDASEYYETEKYYDALEKMYSLSLAVKKWLKFRANNPHEKYDTTELTSAIKAFKKMADELEETALESPLTQIMFSGKIINALARVRTNGIFEPSEGKLTVEGVNIFLPESVQQIGVGAAKIFRYAVAEFTKHNHSNATGEKLNLRFFLDVKDFATANGVDVTSTNAMKNFRRKLSKSLQTLKKAGADCTEKIKGKETHYFGLNYIGGYDLRGNVLELEFTLKMAEYLTSLPQIEYPRSLYGLDDRDFNAFAIGETMCIHYSQDNNVIKGTEGKMRVKALLKYTSFPTYEELKEHRWSWEEKVKEPFEKCLDKLYQCGFLKGWSYCYSGGIKITDEEMGAGIIDSYEKFISLLVNFELHGYEKSEIRAIEIKKKKAEKIKKLQSKRKTNKKSDNN